MMNANRLLLVDNADIVHELDEVGSELLLYAVAERSAVTGLAVRQDTALICNISLKKNELGISCTVYRTGRKTDRANKNGWR